MYFLYVDESFEKESVAVGSTFFPAIKYGKFVKEFDKFLTSNYNIEEDTEIKGDFIWNGREKFASLSMDDRSKTAQEIAEFLSTSKLTKFIVGFKLINGKDKNTVYLELLDKVIEYAANFVAKYSGSTGKQLLVIFDEREDIKEEVHKRLAKQRKDIVQKYKSSCSFIDNGYEGISRYSRLIQVADFVTYFTRANKVLNVQPSLFKQKPDDVRRIAAIKRINELLSKKLKLV